MTTTAGADRLSARAAQFKEVLGIALKENGEQLRARSTELAMASKERAKEISESMIESRRHVTESAAGLRTAVENDFSRRRAALGATIEAHETARDWKKAEKESRRAHDEADLAEAYAAAAAVAAIAAIDEAEYALLNALSKRLDAGELDELAH